MFEFQTIENIFALLVDLIETFHAKIIFVVLFIISGISAVVWQSVSIFCSSK